MKIKYMLVSLLISVSVHADLNMNGIVLTDSCEKKALDIIVEKSCINCEPNEPSFIFKSIERLDIGNDIYGSKTSEGHFYGLFKAILHEVHDGDMPINIDRPFLQLLIIQLTVNNFYPKNTCFSS